MIKLIPLSGSHLPFLLEVRNDITTRYNLENDNFFSLDECREWFYGLKSPWYIIMEGENMVGYFRTNGKEIGCDIHPKYRRNGYSRMAYMAFLENVDLASLWVFDDNFAKKLYLSLGFVEDGETKFIRGRKYIRMIYEK